MVACKVIIHLIIVHRYYLITLSPRTNQKQCKHKSDLKKVGLSSKCKWDAGREEVWGVAYFLRCPYKKRFRTGNYFGSVTAQRHGTIGSMEGPDLSIHKQILKPIYMVKYKFYHHLLPNSHTQLDVRACRVTNPEQQNYIQKTHNEYGERGRYKERS